MCKQSTIVTPTTANSASTMTGSTPVERTNAGCGIDRSCPASVTTSPGRGARLDEYRVKPPIRRKRERNSVIKDTDFEWYDLDAIADAATESNYEDEDSTSKGVQLKGIEINVIIDPITNNSNHSNINPFDIFFETDEEKDDREFLEQLQQLEREVFPVA